MPKTISKYGWHKWNANWGQTPEDTNLLIELECIKRGGRFTHPVEGGEYGEGLFHHHKQAMDMMWPEDDHHRWSDIILKSLCDHEITSIMGSADSGKTYTLSKFILTDWWADPDKTLWMISSTELRGAELRIWGTIKQLYNRARARFEFLEGSVLESKHAIVTEEIDEENEEARLLTKGLIFIPCLSGNTWRGMGLYAGIKPQPGGKLRHAGDETSVMQSSFLDAYANWYGKENFKGVLTGNPTGLEDPLCVASEPIEGWLNWMDTGKTQEWTSRWYNAHVIALDGRDSPNDDHPTDGKPYFSYLISKKKRDAVAATVGPDSVLFWNQCVGKPNPSAESSRVITRRLCEENRAFEKVVWGGVRTTQIVSLDAAYGGVGGDRCVIMRHEFGTDINGNQIFRPHPPSIVPVSVRHSERPEVQIAKFCMAYCLSFGVPPENFFFDGRSTLAVEFARVWSAQVNVVDFGGQPTDRPVSLDEFIWDQEKKERRLKLAKEHYSKFVTELWFSVFYVIISQQMRDLPVDVAEEGARRMWRYAKRSGSQGRLIEVETKAEMKERTRQSPDVFDALCFIGSTLVLTPQGHVPISEIVEGDEVVTPFGTTRVAIKRKNITPDICTAEFSNGCRLTGRTSHKIFTWNGGWVPLGNLSIDNTIESVDNLPIWNFLNLLFAKEESTAFKHLVDIIKTRTGRVSRKDFYTELSGKRKTALFLKVIVSIIKMASGGIIASAISKLLKCESMLECILRRDGAIQKPAPCCFEGYQIGSDSLLIGIRPQREENGTPRTEKSRGNQDRGKLANAIGVERSFSDSSRLEGRFVLTSAGNDAVLKGIPLLIAAAWCVARDFWRTNITRRRLAPSRVLRHSPTQEETVYNLTLEEHNVYFANGILVDNCVGVEGARRRGFQIAKLAQEDVVESREWLRELRNKQDDKKKERQLDYAA